MKGKTKEREGIVRQLSSDFVYLLIKRLATRFQTPENTTANKVEDPPKETLENEPDASKDSQSFMNSQPSDTIVEPASGEDDVQQGLVAPETRIVPPLIIPKLSRILSNKPFVPHVLSLGLDYQTVRAAYYRKRDQKRLNKKIKKNKKVLPPLSSYIRNKPFFPNFIDPVRSDHSFDFSTPKPLTQIDEISSSNKAISPEYNGHEPQPDGIVGELNDDQKLVLIVFFRDLCPALLSAPTQQCNKTNCQLIHEFPDGCHLEQQLLRNSLRDAEQVYEFILMFPSALRRRYFPALARVFVKRNQIEMLKKLVRDGQKIIPFLGFGYFVDEAISSGWTKFAAVKFVIANYADTPDARRAIVGLIGTTDVDVIHFIDYLQKVYQG